MQNQTVKGELPGNLGSAMPTTAGSSRSRQRISRSVSIAGDDGKSRDVSVSRSWFFLHGSESGGGGEGGCGLAEGEAASVGIYLPPPNPRTYMHVGRVVLSDLCNGQREFEVGRSAYLGVTACPAVDGGHQIYASGSCRDRGLQKGAGVVVDTATLNADPPPLLRVDTCNVSSTARAIISQEVKATISSV